MVWGDCLPWSSATFMRNWFLSSSTRLRPCSMKASNLAVNLAMRSRSSSKPKLMLGRVSASDGPPIGGRLVECDGSKTDAIVDTVFATPSLCVVLSLWLLVWKMVVCRKFLNDQPFVYVTSALGMVSGEPQMQAVLSGSDWWMADKDPNPLPHPSTLNKASLRRFPDGIQEGTEASVSCLFSGRSMQKLKFS